LNIMHGLNKFLFSLCFLAMLVFTSSLASSEVITYDYDNAGQVKKVIYGNGATIEYTYDNSGNRVIYQHKGKSGSGLHTTQERLRV